MNNNASSLAITIKPKNDDDENEAEDLPLHFVLILAVPVVIIILFTILGNLLVLRFKARVGRTNTTLLVWNLGLTDFLVGIIVLPLAGIYLLKRKWVFGRTLCRIWVAADVTFCTCSVVTICIISVDRYLSVTRPLQYKSIVTKYKVIVVIILIWMFSTSILATTVRWKQENFKHEECFAGNEIRYLTHSVVFAFFLPATVTLTLYWRVYKLARNRQRALDRGFLMILGHNMNFLTNTLSQTTTLRVHIGPNNGMMEHQRRVLRTHERIAKTLGVVSCSFLFCWLPFFILYLTKYACDSCVPTFVIDIASWLGYCNSMLNPIIYSFTVKEFKKSTLRAIIPIWMFLHNLFPKHIKKPSENNCKTITRNIISKNKPRKNRAHYHANRQFAANDQKRLLLTKQNEYSTSTKHNYTTTSITRSLTFEQSRTREMLLIFHETNTQQRCGHRKISEPIQLFRPIERHRLKSKSIEKIGANVVENNLENDDKTVSKQSDNELVGSSANKSSSSSALSTSSSFSSISMEDLVIRTPCQVKHPKRNSSPAILPFQRKSSKFFWRKNPQSPALKEFFTQHNSTHSSTILLFSPSLYVHTNNAKCLRENTLKTL